jgi:flagellar biogenesis protein FliO
MLATPHQRDVEVERPTPGSLRTFHLFFVIVTVLLCVGFGIWAFVQFVNLRTPGYLATSFLSVVCAATVGVYGRWFLLKMRDQHIR